MVAYNKNEIDFNTCDHNKSVIQYICILCNLPFSIDKEISNKQNKIKEVFNTSSNAAITAKWINKKVLTY
jgi:23S rRNA A2030 N6-methylase RlmJ